MQKKSSLASMVMSKDENENVKGDRQTTERAGRRATTAGAGLRNSQHRAKREGIHRTGRDSRRDDMSAGTSLNTILKGANM